MTTQDMFGTLERTVIALATAEHGRGVLPQGSLGRGLARLYRRLTGDAAVRPLADPRLEALRAFVNGVARSKGPRPIELAAMRAAGYDQRQIAMLSTRRLGG
jgi:hypothetical protein